LPAVTGWKITQQITVDISYVDIDSERAPIDCSAITSGAAFYITGSSADKYMQHAARIQGVHLKGSSRYSSVIGMQFSGPGDSRKLGASYASIVNCIVELFGTGVSLENSAYLIQFDKTALMRNGIGISYPSGYADNGENVTFHLGSISNNECGIYMRTGVISMYGTSIDYNHDHLTEKITKQIDVSSAMLFMYGCYMESKYHDATADGYQPPIKCAGNGGLVHMFGGAITFAASGLIQPDYLISCEPDASSSAAMVVLDGVHIHNVMPTSKKYAITTAYGTVRIINRAGLNISASAHLIGDGATENFIKDGSFEGATITSNVFISGDTAAITDRLNGTNIDLVLDATPGMARTGSKCLKATTGAGATGKFAFICPVTPGGLGNHELYYKKPGSETGDITISGYYGVIDYNADGVPTYLTRTAAIHTDSVTFTSAAVDWTIIEGTYNIAGKRAPAWATHYIVEIDMDAFPSADLYIDDVNMAVT
jgi:hypothetical protein